MSQIPPIVTSVAQSQLTQKQQAARNDATSEAASRSAAEARRKAEASREFVEDMAEATGLKVDEDGQQQQESKKKRRMLDMLDEQEPPLDEEQAADLGDPRAHAAALLTDPDAADRRAPPPCIIDVEA